MSGFAGPDEPTTSQEAKSWVRSLNIDGGGWRLPTEGELKTLRKTGAGIRNMTPLLETTGWYLWYAESDGFSDTWRFNLSHGGGVWAHGNHLGVDRVFAVRSRSDG